MKKRKIGEIFRNQKNEYDKMWSKYIIYKREQQNKKERKGYE